jgi:hypothetical protein
MALDALRSTFRRPGSAAAPMVQAGSPAPAATFQPGTPSFPPVAAWSQLPAPAASLSEGDGFGEADPEPYGLPVQPIAGLPPEPAWAVAEPAPAVAAPASGPATTSSYAADQYAAVFADPIAGGGTDTAAFGCPSCGRTLDRGTLRCEGCGTWLLLDMPLKRAALLAGGGILAGIVVTILLVNLFAPARPAAVTGLEGATGAGSGAVSIPLDIPSGAVAALRGTTAITGRLAAEAAPLQKALDAKKFRTGDVQKVLRRMAIDARAGSGMLTSLAPWPEAAGQQAALEAFYSTLQRQIDGGLSASVRSTGAYKKAAKAVLATLGTAPGLDADARTLAGQAGVELVPVTFPDSLR